MANPGDLRARGYRGGASRPSPRVGRRATIRAHRAHGFSGAPHGAIAQLGERLVRNQEVAGSSPASSIVPPRRARRRRPARPGSPSSARPVVPRAAPSSEQAPDPVPEHRQEQAEAAEGRGGSRGHHRRGLRRGGPGLSRRGVGAPGRMCPLGGGGRCRRRVPLRFSSSCRHAASSPNRRFEVSWIMPLRPKRASRPVIVKSVSTCTPPQRAAADVRAGQPDAVAQQMDQQPRLDLAPVHLAVDDTAPAPSSPSGRPGSLPLSAGGLTARGRRRPVL